VIVKFEDDKKPTIVKKSDFVKRFSKVNSQQGKEAASCAA
jgi:hypothetical protein